MADRPILGLTEEVTFFGNNEHRDKLRVRVDSGATCSSIDKALAEKLALGPVTRDKLVKSASGMKKRPLVMVKVEIKGRLIEREFSLADRSHMTYPALIGQNVLKEGRFLIDPLQD